ncbi:hypothetical protein, partial [Nostoc sp. DedSLP04]|uniref:hypothetical protein n=1 Tax=Nostoc sp. DedSLP04 TaxID=3075401 RepID=UPI002AD234BC
VDERVFDVDSSSSKVDERVFDVDSSSSKVDERVFDVDSSSSKVDERDSNTNLKKECDRYIRTYLCSVWLS